MKMDRVVSGGGGRSSLSLHIYTDMEGRKDTLFKHVKYKLKWPIYVSPLQCVMYSYIVDLRCVCHPKHPRRVRQRKNGGGIEG